MSEINTVNVEEIMRNIKAEIKEKGLSDDVLSFTEIPIPEQINTVDPGVGPYNEGAFMTANMQMNRLFQVSTWQQVTGNPAIKFVKKVNRKLVRFFIDPIVNEQNKFNMKTTVAMNQIRNYMVEKGDALKDAQEELKILVEQVNKLQKETAELKEKLNNNAEDAN